MSDCMLMLSYLVKGSFFIILLFQKLVESRTVCGTQILRTLQFCMGGIKISRYILNISLSHFSCPHASWVNATYSKSTQHRFNVHTTSPQCYEHCINVETMLWAYRKEDNDTRVYLSFLYSKASSLTNAIGTFLPKMDEIYFL